MWTQRMRRRGKRGKGSPKRPIACTIFSKQIHMRGAVFLFQTNPREGFHTTTATPDFLSTHEPSSTSVPTVWCQREAENQVPMREDRSCTPTATSRMSKSKLTRCAMLRVHARLRREYVSRALSG